VEPGRGVEPEVEPHLAAHDAAVAAAAHVHVRLQRVGLPGDGAQELHVDLVVEPRVRLVVGEVEGGVGARGVPSGELDAGREVAVPVRVLRLEPAPCFVDRDFM
jgi:hypothetical protein